jgi:hypothetical protein
MILNPKDEGRWRRLLLILAEYRIVAIVQTADCIENFEVS